MKCMIEEPVKLLVMHRSAHEHLLMDCGGLFPSSTKLTLYWNCKEARRITLCKVMKCNSYEI